MNPLSLALMGSMLLNQAPPATPPATPPASGSKEVKVAPLQAREVIEKLKTLRAQILLDEEYNHLLEVRVERMKLEQALETGDASVATEGAKPSKPASSGGGASKASSAARANVPPPPSLDSSGAQLAVKSVTVSPFKEAMVVYKGRLYTVRPGDTLGPVKINDITENGVITNGASVTLEQ